MNLRHRNALAEGARLHWYEIRSVLGQGAFGITYLARDTNLDQLVAIKEFLPQELAMRDGDGSVHATSDERAGDYQWGLSRFLDEARTLAKFRHPNIVRVGSVFEANNTAYMVMHYEQGRPLADALRERVVDGEQALKTLLEPLLEGIEHMHQAGFIHRDIKPSNVYIRANGTPVLIDFGSARLALADHTRTLTSVVSPGYAPFEQYESSEGGTREGPWTDIYSVAAVLYLAVTRSAPPDALKRANALLEGREDPLVPARNAAGAGFSPGFLAAIDAGLAFRAGERPGSVAAWRRLLAAENDDEDDVTVLRGSQRPAPEEHLATVRLPRGSEPRGSAPARGAETGSQASPAPPAPEIKPLSGDDAWVETVALGEPPREPPAAEPGTEPQGSGQAWVETLPIGGQPPPVRPGAAEDAEVTVVPGTQSFPAKPVPDRAQSAADVAHEPPPDDTPPDQPRSRRTLIIAAAASVAAVLVAVVLAVVLWPEQPPREPVVIVQQGTTPPATPDLGVTADASATPDRPADAASGSQPDTATTDATGRSDSGTATDAPIDPAALQEAEQRWQQALESARQRRETGAVEDTSTATQTPAVDRSAVAPAGEQDSRTSAIATQQQALAEDLQRLTELRQWQADESAARSAAAPDIALEDAADPETGSGVAATQEQALADDLQRLTELERQQAEEEARQQAEVERQQAEEEARQAELERQQAEEAARQQAEEVARQQAELERQQAEEEARQAELERQQAEEAARQQAELERLQAEEETRQQAELARQQAEEAARQQAELERQQAEEVARQQAELERQQAEEEARQAELERQQAAAAAPEVESESRVQSLLAAAEDDLAATRLTSPAGRNALEKYQQVLEMDPDNAAAEEGKQRIVQRYLVLAEGALRAGQRERAAVFLQRAETVLPGDPAVAAARDALPAAGSPVGTAASTVSAGAGASSPATAGGTPSLAFLGPMCAGCTAGAEPVREFNESAREALRAAGRLVNLQAAPWLASPPADAGDYSRYFDDASPRAPRTQALLEQARRSGVHAVVVAALEPGAGTARVYLVQAGDGRRFEAAGPAANAGILLTRVLAQWSAERVAASRGDTPAPQAAAPRLAVLGQWCVRCGSDAEERMATAEQAVRTAVANLPQITLHSAPWPGAPAPLARADDRERFWNDAIALVTVQPQAEALVGLARTAGADAVLITALGRLGGNQYHLRVFVIDAVDGHVWQAQGALETADSVAADAIRQWRDAQAAGG